MTKYKLVPVEPTREMWAAAGDAVVALNSQHHDAISEAVYKAMLAVAPTVGQSPEVSKLVEALELFMNSPTPTGEDFDKARAAIVAYRKQGGDL